MAINYAYHFAEIDNTTHMCVGVVSTSGTEGWGETAFNTTYVPIPVYDEEYVMKYYFCDNHPEVVPNCNDGQWYIDPNKTTPWVSSLL